MTSSVDIAAAAKLEIDVPWDDLRAARVHKKALAEFKAGNDADAALPEMSRVDEELAEESSDQEHAEESGDQELAEESSDQEHAEQSGDQELAEDDPLLALVRPKRVSWTWWAAALTIAAAILLVVQFRGAETEFASTLHYRDGSRSLLSAQAQVRVIEDRDARVAVRQRAGHVRYDIMPRKERSFVVSVDGVTITVLGTVFDVNVEDAHVKVSVERGRVRVETDGRTLELTAGEHATLRRDGSDTDVATLDEAPAQDASDGATAKLNPNEGDSPPPSAPPAALPNEDANPGDAAPSVPEVATAEESMQRADAARASGDLEGALSALRQLLRDHPQDGRATLALFTIGQVERQRGNHANAGRAFDQCGAALKGDAFAEAAMSWQAAGQSTRAAASARRYLTTYPRGVHADTMRKLSGAD